MEPIKYKSSFGEREQMVVNRLLHLICRIGIRIGSLVFLVYSYFTLMAVYIRMNLLINMYSSKLRHVLQIKEIYWSFLLALTSAMAASMMRAGVN